MFDTVPEHVEHDDNTTELCQCRETDDIKIIQCGPLLNQGKLSVRSIIDIYIYNFVHKIDKGINYK